MASNGPKPSAARRIAVIGSRDFNDYERLEAVVLPHLLARLTSGGAKGADALAERLATEQGCRSMLCLRTGSVTVEVQVLFAINRS